ncbi:hypothetical protein P280DRAFT_538107 [Massarina eburnea CBS 473.64]|uniref:RING-type domain-containing protein n=1 Tax=Massarina eburnea CBS 473.64 TaxID=1395130 RepID=A0A6A6S8S4_9PLEO|nr:hypothetical protein P280DRAFT_538107 [Massarina eburnea CBS 473.64]
MSTPSTPPFDYDSDSTYLPTPSPSSTTSSQSDSNYAPNPHLPTYASFRASLIAVDTGTLSPGAECPICRAPYSPTQASPIEESEARTSHLLRALPLAEEHGYIGLDDDRPVRLPCSGRHVVGEVCMRGWAQQGGTTCPLDREQLFNPPRHPRHQNFPPTQYALYERGQRSINTTPLRTLLNHARAFTPTDIVLIDNIPGRLRLAPLILRFAFRTSGFDMPLEWHPSLRWPWLTGSLRRGREALSMTRYIRSFIEDIPLLPSGQYAAWVRLLLDPMVPGMYAVLYRLINQYTWRRMNAVELSALLQSHVDRYFRHGVGEGGVVLGDVRRLASNVVGAWVAQELLMTRLRDLTGRSNGIERVDGYDGEDSLLDLDVDGVGGMEYDSDLSGSDSDLSISDSDLSGSDSSTSSSDSDDTASDRFYDSTDEWPISVSPIIARRLQRERLSRYSERLLSRE